MTIAVSAGSRWGVVGENGRGKTTLLQVLSGAITPDAGSVHLHGTLGVADQHMTTVAEAGSGVTVGDAIDRELAAMRAVLVALEESAGGMAAGRAGAGEDYARALAAAEALDAWDADRRVDVALAALGAVSDRARPLGTLSVGQRYRVRLACLLGAGHDFLLLDEPTNHLDAAGLEFLTARLIDYPGGIVLVSHDRALLGDVADTILDLDPTVDGRAVVHGGGYAGFRAGRESALVRWEQEYARQQETRARLERDLSAAQDRLVTGWRPDKGVGKHKRATRAPGLVRSAHRRREDLERHAVTAPEPPLRFHMPELPATPTQGLGEARGRAEARGRTEVTGRVEVGDRAGLVVVEEVVVEGRLRRPVSLVVGAGARLLVSGPNGAGKSTLLGVLAGRREVSGGRVWRACGVRLGILAQEAPEGEARCAEEVVPEIAEFGLLSVVDRARPVRELSLGQQRRVDLARVLAARPHVVLLDEPSNHLSITLVDELTDALRVTRAAVVVATHDRQMRRDLRDWPGLSVAG
ncbi:ATP-binding cassette domain-containing protein [Actinoplanes sp. NPDC051861]|uniref:ATP-binding cassette domain-containing protein n=1 Tax=Actinoplanes sp. NPDC051861 TaxID=3155170 RepID=UPI0034334D63